MRRRIWSAGQPSCRHRQVFTQDLASWIRDWAIANDADDFVPDAQPVYTHPSWNLRSAVSGVNEGAWPLRTIPLDSINVTFVGIADGGAAYLRYGIQPSKVGGGRLTSRGGTLPENFTISILRTK